MSRNGDSGGRRESSGRRASVVAEGGDAEAVRRLLPYLSEGFCRRCKTILEERIDALAAGNADGVVLDNGDFNEKREKHSVKIWETVDSGSVNGDYSSGDHKTHDDYRTKSNGNSRQRATKGDSYDEEVSSSQHGDSSKRSSYPGGEQSNSGSIDHYKYEPGQSHGRLRTGLQTNGRSLFSHAIEQVPNVHRSGEEERERIGFMNVRRKKDFVYWEKIEGKRLNVLEGLELHSHVFSVAEQKKIVDCVYDFQKMGRNGELRERTYSEPVKWMRGKGRVTIQFGCCYNYARDKAGNPPGIIQSEQVDPIPPLFKMMIKRLVAWHVLPPTCVPDSCIVNIYDEGDCIPPHIDHHDFVRPFCTVSFLTEANILFGANLKIRGPGEFAGPVSIPLPVGSVLILNGNGADVAKHCVPGVPGKRISITFRKMDPSKVPFDFRQEPDLQGFEPLEFPSNISDYSTPKTLNNKTSSSSSSSVVSKRLDDVQEESSSSRSTPLSFSVSDFPVLETPAIQEKRQGATDRGSWSDKNTSR